jgi:hypothetical protein
MFKGVLLVVAVLTITFLPVSAKSSTEGLMRNGKTDAIVDIGVAAGGMLASGSSLNAQGNRKKKAMEEIEDESQTEGRETCITECPNGKNSFTNLVLRPSDPKCKCARSCDDIDDEETRQQCTEGTWVCGAGEQCKINCKSGTNPNDPRKTKCLKDCSDDPEECKGVSEIWSPGTDPDADSPTVEELFSDLNKQCFGENGVADKCRKSCGCSRGSYNRIMHAKSNLQLDKGNLTFSCHRSKSQPCLSWRKHSDNSFLWVKTSIYGACRASRPNKKKPAEQYTEIARAVPYEEMCAQRCAREPKCKGYEYSQFQGETCNNKQLYKGSGKCEIHWVAPDGKEPDFNPIFSCYRKLDFNSPDDTKELANWHGKDDTKNYQAMCNYFCDLSLEDVVPDSSDKPTSCYSARSNPESALWQMINAKLLPDFDYAECLASPKYLYTKGFVKCWGTKCETWLRKNGISKAVVKEVEGRKNRRRIRNKVKKVLSKVR